MRIDKMIGKRTLASMPTHGPRKTMQSHVDQFLYQRRSRLAPTTMQNLTSTLHRFAAWWDGARKVPLTLRAQDVHDYVWGPHRCCPKCTDRWHYGPGLRATYEDRTLNRALGQLRSFLEWAFRHGYVKGETIEATLERARPRRKRRLRLGHEDLVALYEGAEDPYHRWVCALAVYTAGRNGELLSLRVRDLDLDAGELVWSRHKTGDDADVLPVVSELECEARRWLTHYERAVGQRPLPGWFLVPRRQHVGTPTDGRKHYRYLPDEGRTRGLHVIVKQGLARVLDRNADQLRGEGVHTARRSMARLLYERLRRDAHPDPISVVQALLGHANRAMTERYIGVESGRVERDRLLRGRTMLGED